MPKKPENRLEKAQGFSRRTFIGGAAASMAALTALPRRAQASIPGVPARAVKFKLKYAPYFGMFENHAGKDRIDQIKFAADQGFRAMFDNGFMNRPAAEQEILAREMDRLGLEWGPFVAYADFKVKSFVTRDPEIRAMLKKRTQTAASMKAWSGTTRRPMSSITSSSVLRSASLLGLSS